MARGKSNILKYGLVLGIGVGLGYVIGTMQTQVEAVIPQATPYTANATRWTSGYQYLGNGSWPGAGAAESAYPYGEQHKMTMFSPQATTMNAPLGDTGNGSIIFID